MRRESRRACGQATEAAPRLPGGSALSVRVSRDCSGSWKGVSAMCRCRGLAPAFATEDPALKFTGGLGGNVDVDEVRRVEVVQLVLKGVGPALIGIDLDEDVGLSDGGLFLAVPRVVVAECLG